MRRVLQLAALVVALGAIVIWLATGANRGWTKTSRPVTTLDEVTGIEGITYEKHFSPGVDFLWAALLAGGAMTCVSLIFRRPKPKPQTQADSPSV